MSYFASSIRTVRRSVMLNSISQWNLNRARQLAIGFAIASVVAAGKPTALGADEPRTEAPAASHNPNGATVEQAPLVRPIERKKAPYQPRAVSSKTIDWTTMQSTYTHGNEGQRVDQHSEGIEPTTMVRNDYMRSGFRHSRSTLQAGFGSDNYHQVEQWGPSVRPYGEWRYPFRPFSSPYSMWGPQLPQVMNGMPWWGGFSGGWGANMGANGMPPNGMVPPGIGPNGMGNGNMGVPFGGGANGLGVGPWNALPPTQDDYYPQAPILSAPEQGPAPNYNPYSFGLE